MLAGQFEPELPLHGCKQLDLRPLLEHLLNQRQIREIVFDVKQRATRRIRM